MPSDSFSSYQLPHINSSHNSPSHPFILLLSECMSVQLDSPVGVDPSFIPDFAQLLIQIQAELVSIGHSHDQLQSPSQSSPQLTTSAPPCTAISPLPTPNSTPCQTLSIPPVPLDTLSTTPFPIFVPTTINSLEVSKASFSGYLVPTPEIAYLARQWENRARLNGTANQTDQLFPIPAQPYDSFEFPCPNDILSSPCLAKYLNLYKQHTMLFYQSISQPTINSYQLIPSLIGKCEHTNTIYRTFSLQSNPLLNSRFYSIYPAPPQMIRKFTQAPSIMIRETSELYHTLHKPYIVELTKDTRALQWLFDVLDGKKESETILLRVIDPKFPPQQPLAPTMGDTDSPQPNPDTPVDLTQSGSHAFILAKDTKWTQELYSQALLWSACQEVDEFGHKDDQKQLLSRTLSTKPSASGNNSNNASAPVAAVTIDTIPSPLVDKSSDDLILTDEPPQFPDDEREVLPNWLAKPIWCLALPMDRTLHSIRDLNASHLPLLKSMRNEIHNWFFNKFNIPASKLVMYFHYSPTFYHLHLHVNHISLITESTFTGKVEELSCVINNIEMMPDYYQKCTKLMYLSETHGVVARFKQYHAEESKE